MFFLSRSLPELRFLRRAERKQRLGYLVGALAHSVDQLLDDHVHTLDAGLLQLYDLLLHNSFEGHVWGKKPGPDNKQDKVNTTFTIKCLL